MANDTSDVIADLQATIRTLEDACMLISKSVGLANRALENYSESGDDLGLNAKNAIMWITNKFANVEENFNLFMDNLRQQYNFDTASPTSPPPSSPPDY